MKKTLLWMACLTIGIFSISNAFSDSTPPLSDKACSITCYEKSPSCYVTSDKPGCLDISDKKPVCKKKSCVCEMKGCNTKTNY